jgi:hypothetical protein
MKVIQRFTNKESLDASTQDHNHAYRSVTD